MHPEQFRDYLVEPVLRGLEMYSDAAAELMMMTAAHESHLGYYLAQAGGGPACGAFQIEPATARDILGRYLITRPDIAERVRPPLGVDDLSALAQPDRVAELRIYLICDLHFQASIARIKYWMSPDPLPAADDVVGLAEYYKKHYNTVEGAADVSMVIEDYTNFVGG